jgi:hypothetical protein
MGDKLHAPITSLSNSDNGLLDHRNDCPSYCNDRCSDYCSSTPTSSDSGSDSGSDCGSDNECDKPLADGFERVVTECGQYDQEILKEGHVRCNGCNASVDPTNTKTGKADSGIKCVCNNCINNNRIVECAKCGIFIRPFFGIFRRKTFRKGFNEPIYCDDCTPPILFIYNVAEPYNTKIEIPIPKKNEYGISEKYFFGYIAEKLSVNPDNIRIEGEKCRNVMYCPIEFTKEKYRTFNVTVV